VSASAHPTAPPRLLYIPNEEVLGQQAAPRRAFEQMLADGALEDYGAVALPWQASASASGSIDGALAEVERRAREVQPTIVLWQHIGRFPIPVGVHRRLASLEPVPVIAFQDLDPWGWVRHRLPRPSRQLARRADVVCLCGLGSFARVFRAAGARRVHYTAHGYDPERFDVPSDGDPEPDLDVVMIGNRITSRLPGMRIAGNRQREALATRLHARYGERFGCFGNGWAGFAFDRGPIDYDDQVQVARRSRVTVGWDHFPRTPYYFSDRLPIALMAGVPHVTNWAPGYERQFAGCDALTWGRTVADVADAVARRLDQPDRLRRIDGRQGVAFARRHFNQHDQFRGLVAYLDDLRRGGQARGAPEPDLRPIRGDR
jgi:hypothetical protein